MPDATSPTIDVRLLEKPVTLPPDALPEDCGGECVFLGRTRAETHETHGALRRLTYEAHTALAERELRAIATEAATQHDCRHVLVLHALGPVAVGEASVLVQVAAPHRAESFAACRQIIDELKARVPIWKREEWADGTTWSDGTVVGTDGTAC